MRRVASSRPGTSEVRERMRERTPEAGVVAANDAVANALLQLAAFLLHGAG